MAALAVATAATSGCAVYEQVQYFAASDRETGVTNYYKMTVSGWGGGGTDYHMQAGYFSAAAVDMLRGSMPNIPILDLSVEQQEVFDRLAQQFYAALIQEAKQQYEVTDREALLIATQGRSRLATQRAGKLQGDLHRARMELARAEADWKKKRDDCDAAASKLPAEQGAYEEAMKAYEATPADETLKKAADKKAAALREAQRKLAEARRKAERAGAVHGRLFDKVQSLEAELALNESIFKAAGKLTNKLASGTDGSGDAGTSERAPFGDPEVVGLARLVWFGSLTKSDIASIGMNQTTDPFQFRKLVFWATANNIDLNQYAGQIDAVIDNVVAIASSYKSQAKARKQARKSRRESLTELIGGLNLGEKEGAIRSLLDLAVPPPAQSATVPPEGGAQ